MVPGNEKTLEEAIGAKFLMPDEDLFEEIGQSLGKGATFTDALKRGRQVVENLRRDLKVKICSSSGIIDCFHRSKTDPVQVVAAIVDTIAGSLHGIPPINIAILLYRSGLKAYCGPDWPPDQSYVDSAKEGR